jgi:hypothetical protein
MLVAALEPDDVVLGGGNVKNQAFQGSRFHLFARCLAALRAWRMRKVETWGRFLL